MIICNVMCVWRGGRGLNNNKKNNNKLGKVVTFWLAKVIALYFSFTKTGMNTGKGKNAKLMINLAILAIKFGAVIYGNLESKHLSLLLDTILLPSTVVASDD